MRFSISVVVDISFSFLDSAKMIFLAYFLFAVCVANPFHLDSGDCFENSERDCMENFVDAVFYNKGEVDECSELWKFVHCSMNAAEECFEDEHDERVNKGLEELKNLCKDTCGAVSSGDNSNDFDFDEETYGHIQFKATFRKRKKPSHSTTDKETSVKSHSKNCFGERKKICWETFEKDVIHSVFFSSTGLDKCSVLQHLVLCTQQAAADCLKDEYDDDALEVIEVWRKKSKEFCKPVVNDDEITHGSRDPFFTINEPFFYEDYDETTDCEYGRKIYEHREEWNKDACTSCVCVQGNTICDTEECPDVECKTEKYTPPGKCCPTCVSSLDVSSVPSVSNTNTTSLSPLSPRKKNCMIRDLGSPEFRGLSDEEVGAWFEDAMPNDDTEYKYYTALASDTNHLHEYESRDPFHKDRDPQSYWLPFRFNGTGHVVYNGSFYYHEAKTQMLVRCEFKNSGVSLATRIVDASYNDGHYLYSSELGYMDVMADENGLWVVYSAKDTNNTLVRKIHPYYLTTEYMWNLTFPHSSVGEMFIACGVLYAVDSVTETSTHIRFAFDLYQNKTLQVDIPLTNPFSASMFAYNPKHGKIYTWVTGNQLSYPVEFDTTDVGNDEERDDSK